MAEGIQNVRDKVVRVKALLVARATQKQEPEHENEYAAIRADLMDTPEVRAALPQFVRDCGTIAEFWDHIRDMHQTDKYMQRREYLRERFQPILDELEQGRLPPGGFVGDLFRRQFPAGLPFGLNKPHVSLRPEGKGQVIEFEAEANVGVIRAGAYPGLTFAGLKAAVVGQPVDHARFAEKLATLIQTEKEQEFFNRFAAASGMFTGDVPVLVPQAWIQWHSKTKPDLRAAASSHADDLYRVDFVAFWKGRRFAILIDDINHYGMKAVTRWDASEERYSSRLKEDRKLRKEGWEVFRVSNWEIRNSGLLSEIIRDLREFLEG